MNISAAHSSRIASKLAAAEEALQKRDLTAFEGIPGTRFKIRDVTSDHKYLHKWSLQAQEAAKKLGKGKDEEAEKVLRDARVVIGDDKVDAILMLSQLRQLRKQVQRRLAMTRAHYGLSYEVELEWLDAQQQ